MPGCVWNRAQAQTAAAGPSAFEVASIRLHQGDDHQETNLLPGGRFVGINASVKKLMRLSLGVEESQIVGGPDWTASDRYDIDAKTGETTQLEPPEFQRLMLALLQDRFQLKFHRETREREVYRLEAQKNGMKLKPHEGPAGLTMNTNRTGTTIVLEARDISMHDLASALTRQVGRPVEDDTGIAGTFDVRLEWDDDETDATAPSIFTAIQEQLGLKLTAAKGAVDVVVIDHVKRPSEN